MISATESQWKSLFKFAKESGAVVTRLSPHVFGVALRGEITLVKSPDEGIYKCECYFGKEKNTACVHIAAVIVSVAREIAVLAKMREKGS